MIITKLNGGLGNQLFQYAVGRTLAINNNTELKLDTACYNKNDYRNYSLNNFNIKENIAGADEIGNFNKKGFGKIIEKLKPRKCRSIFVEKNYSFDRNILKIKDNKYLIGYWQSEKYFIGTKDAIKNEITLKNELDEKFSNLLSEIKNNNSVSIHFRQTDYTSAKNSVVYSNLNVSYYKKAIQIIEKSVKSPRFFIFSDDIAWVKKNITLPASSVYVSDGTAKDYEELILMSKCKHNIIANSTFSWWGAWLNNNPDKIVIAPEKWFKDKNKDTKDLIPDNWIKI